MNIIEMLQRLRETRGKPPFSNARKPFCTCGWPIPGPIQLWVKGGEAVSLRLRCPMCGRWHETDSTKTDSPKPGPSLRLVVNNARRPK